jgi:hypothetical protein
MVSVVIALTVLCVSLGALSSLLVARHGKKMTRSIGQPDHMVWLIRSIMPMPSSKPLRA